MGNWNKKRMILWVIILWAIVMGCFVSDFFACPWTAVFH